MANGIGAAKTGAELFAKHRHRLLAERSESPVSLRCLQPTGELISAATIANLRYSNAAHS